LETVSYGYNASYQNWEDQLTEYGWESIRYDGAGNPTYHRFNNMVWEGKRLTKHTSYWGDVTQFAYNESGIRTSKTYNGTKTTYDYNGSLLMLLRKGDDRMTFYYDATGLPLMTGYNGSAYYYIYNAQGDVVKLINHSGTTVVEYKYSTWGEPVSITGSAAATVGKLNPFRYRGYVWDEETGYYYLESRYYDPFTCRFLNADALLSTGQGVLGYNMYAYCRNNPVTRSDASGTYDTPSAWAQQGAAAQPDTYYFYGGDQTDHARLNIQLLIDSGKSVRGIPVAGQADFTAGWNNMASSVDTVVINMHGYPGGSSDINMSALDPKSIDTLLLLLCNSGHQDLSNNLVSQFASQHTVGQIVGVDGLHGRKSDGGGTTLNGTSFQNNASGIALRGGGTLIRSPRGFILSRNGSITVLGQDYSSVASLLGMAGK